MKKVAGNGGSASPAGDETSWYSLDGVECADRLRVDPATGLGAAEAAGRLEVHGLNQLTCEKQRPLWQLIVPPHSRQRHVLRCSRRNRSIPLSRMTRRLSTRLIRNRAR